MMEQGTITRMLGAMNRGVDGAREELYRRVHKELRQMAAGRLRHEAARAACSPTDLAHEAFIRLEDGVFDNRRKLFYCYGREMERVLVDQARRARALKRGGDRRRVPLDQAQTAVCVEVVEHRLDAADVGELMDRLRVEAHLEADVVQLKFFGGLCDEDIAEVIGADVRTVRRRWKRAKDRLFKWTQGWESN